MRKLTLPIRSCPSSARFPRGVPGSMEAADYAPHEVAHMKRLVALDDSADPTVRAEAANEAHVIHELKVLLGGELEVGEPEAQPEAVQTSFLAPDEGVASHFQIPDSIRKKLGLPAPGVPDFDGVTIDPARDKPRLFPQLQRVGDVMADGRWLTLEKIGEATGDPQASVSARLRDFRKPKFGGHEVERRYVSEGLHEYRLIRNQQTVMPLGYGDPLIDDEEAKTA